MAWSESSAGDVAQVVFEALEKRYGGDVSWVEGEYDAIDLTDENGAAVFVKVELA